MTYLYCPKRKNSPRIPVLYCEKRCTFKDQCATYPWIRIGKLEIRKEFINEQKK